MVVYEIVIKLSPMYRIAPPLIMDFALYYDKCGYCLGLHIGEDSGTREKSKMGEVTLFIFPTTNDLSLMGERHIMRIKKRRRSSGSQRHNPGPTSAFQIKFH